MNNKIQFKLNRRQVMIWLNFLQEVSEYSQFNSDTLSKMYIANIKELIARLKEVTGRKISVKYTFSIVMSQCWAFQFLMETIVADVSPTDAVTLNEIAGIIDLKSKNEHAQY